MRDLTSLFSFTLGSLSPLCPVRRVSVSSVSCFVRPPPCVHLRVNLYGLLIFSLSLFLSVSFSVSLNVKMNNKGVVSTSYLSPRRGQVETCYISQNTNFNHCQHFFSLTKLFFNSSANIHFKKCKKMADKRGNNREYMLLTLRSV